MFWKLSFRQPSAIDTLLDKEDCTLYEILDEDDVLQECKTQNKKLIDFLARAEILEQLIVLISQEPHEDVEDKVKFKYPHIACELLTSEVLAIVEQLSTNDHLLGLLWAFLDNSDTLNPLIGSFISKTLAMLLMQKASVIFDYMRSREDFIQSFLAHLGTSAMMDLLLQMVAAPDNDQSRIDLAEWLKEQEIVEKLVDFIHPNADSEQCYNASQALCDMLRLSREAAQMASPTPLLSTLESEETMQRLLGNLFGSESPPDIVIVSGILVLLTALEKRPATIISPGMMNRSSFGPTDHEDSATCVGGDSYPGQEQVLSVVVPRLRDFHDLLTRRPNMAPMVTTVGTLNPPLGNTRLQVVRLFSALLQCNNTRVASEIVRLKTFTVLMDLFFEYPWNNFLHTQVECCVNAALTSSVVLNGGKEEEGGEGGGGGEGDGGEGDGEGQKDSNSPVSLRHHLLSECHMVHSVLKGVEKNETICSQPGGQRQGYMGHLIRIVNSLVQSGERDETLPESARGLLDEDTQRRWSEFVGGTLAETNRRNETNLGGNRPMSSSMDDSDEEFDQLSAGPDSELEKAYQQYLDVKYISTMREDYGMEDELNSQEEPFGATFSRLMDISCTISAEEEQSQANTLFEAACSERIQPFDDSESDEEDSNAWEADQKITFVSPMDQQSVSSDEDEDFDHHPRELQTGSSDEEGEGPSKRAAHYLPTAPNSLAAITSTVKGSEGDNMMEIDSAFGVPGAISWHSDVSTDEDLSGAVAMDTEGGRKDWTKEPVETGSSPSARSPGSNWADFTVFSKDSQEDTSPQDMDLEPVLEPSDITLTYVSPETGQKREVQQQQEQEQQQGESPQRHNTQLYNPLISPGSSTDQRQSPQAKDTSQVPISHKHESSSSDEDNTSSDSDDERSGTYRLNTSSSSEKELLLTGSPGQPAGPSSVETTTTTTTTTTEPRSPGVMEQEPVVSAEGSPREQPASSQTPPEHEASANGIQEQPAVPATSSATTNHRPEQQEEEEPRENSEDSEGLKVEHNSTAVGADSAAGHESIVTGNHGKVNEDSGPLVQDGEADPDNLSDNFSFLSHGLLSESGSRRKADVTDEQKLLEEKRTEALEACAQYEKEVQGSQDWVET